MSKYDGCKARAAAAYARETWRNDGAEGETVHILANAVEHLQAVLSKIDAIRNSIIGAQAVNWSEHIYPLVSALAEADFAGESHESARKNIGTLLDRLRALEGALGEVAALGDRCEECEPTEAPFATHVAMHPIHGLPMFLCREHAEEARQGTGWERPLEVDEHEQDTAVLLALKALAIEVGTPLPIGGDP